MLAEQLLAFAQDFVEEYNQLKIIDLFSRASALLQVRGTPNESNYEQRAVPLRAECANIVATTRFRTYPAVWRRPISESDFARYLPAEVARIISTALPSNFSVAPLSTELLKLQGECNAAYSVAQSFIPFSQRFELKRTVIPKDELGIMVFLPRSSYDNEVNGFASKLKHFSDLVATLAEIVTGSRREPTLVYVATSDPLVCLATVITLASPFLQFYTDILDLLVKQLELRKAIGSIREMGYAPPELPEHGIRMGVSDVVEKLFQTHCNVADDGRKKELESELAARAMAVIPSLEAGGRLSLAATTTQNTITSFIGYDGAETQITQRLETTHQLEIRLDAASTAPAPLIPFERRTLSS